VNALSGATHPASTHAYIYMPSMAVFYSAVIFVSTIRKTKIIAFP